MIDQDFSSQDLDLNIFDISNEFSEIEIVLQGFNGESDIMMDACVRRC